MITCKIISVNKSNICDEVVDSILLNRRGVEYFFSIRALRRLALEAYIVSKNSEGKIESVTFFSRKRKDVVINVEEKWMKDFSCHCYKVIDCEITHNNGKKTHIKFSDSTKRSVFVLKD